MASRNSCNIAGEAPESIPASIYSPFTFSFSLACSTALSIFSRLNADVPAPPINMSKGFSSARSDKVPSSFITSTEFFSTFGADVPIAMPINISIEKNPIKSPATTRPTTVANTYFKNCFIRISIKSCFVFN